MVEQIFTAARGGPMLQQRKRMRRKKGPPIASLKGLSVTCGNNKEGRRGAWSELEPGKGGGKVFSLSV